MTLRPFVAVLLACLALAGCGQPQGGGDGPLILVTGATGNQGGAVARELLARGYRVRGLTRNPDSDRARALAKTGAVMVQGDFDNPASLVAAMQGVYGVFAMTDFWEHGMLAEIEHGENLIAAAQKSGVGHFIYTSVAGADRQTGLPHFESKRAVEEQLEASGLRYSVVRPVEFMDNVRWSRKTIMTGVYFDPRGTDKTHQWIAVSDIGFFVAEAFDNPDEWASRTLEIAGDELSIAEYVEILSRTVGLDVHHQQVSWNRFEEQAGLEIADMYRWFDAKGYDVDVAGLRARYPELLTVEQYLLSLGWGDAD